MVSATTDGVSHALREAIDWHMSGRTDEAAARYREILVGEPNNALAAHPLGVLLLQARAYAEAAEQLARAVASAPRWGEAWNNLGVSLRHLGRTPEAIVAFRTAVRERPALFDAHNNLAESLFETEDLRGAMDVANVAHSLDPNHASPLVTLGAIHLMDRAYAEAIECSRAAVALDPTNERAAALYRTARSGLVDPWHIAMVNETSRNDAYDAAIRRAVTPGALVFEIGTGTGILAMMAARAGAGRVVTCEMLAPVAEKARAIIERNGYADRITVHHSHSTEMNVGVELPARASVMISEIFDSNVVGEGVLTSLEDAHLRLLEPDAKLVPQAASPMIVLAAGPLLSSMVRVDSCAGFDLSPFNDFTPERVMFDGTRIAFEELSAPTRALRFDFRERRHPPTERVVDMEVTRSGLCLGVVQWLHIELDGESVYENRPGVRVDSSSGWLHALFTFEEAVSVREGQALRVRVGHGRQALYVRFVSVV